MCTLFLDASNIKIFAQNNIVRFMIPESNWMMSDNFHANFCANVWFWLFVLIVSLVVYYQRRVARSVIVILTVLEHCEKSTWSKNFCFDGLNLDTDVCIISHLEFVIFVYRFANSWILKHSMCLRNRMWFHFTLSIQNIVEMYQSWVECFLFVFAVLFYRIVFAGI